MMCVTVERRFKGTVWPTENSNGTMFCLASICERRFKCTKWFFPL